MARSAGGPARRGCDRVRRGCRAADYVDARHCRVRPADVDAASAYGDRHIGGMLRGRAGERLRVGRGIQRHRHNQLCRAGCRRMGYCAVIIRFHHQFQYGQWRLRRAFPGFDKLHVPDCHSGVAFHAVRRRGVDGACVFSEPNVTATGLSRVTRGQGGLASAAAGSKGFAGAE